MNSNISNERKQRNYSYIQHNSLQTNKFIAKSVLNRYKKKLYFRIQSVCKDPFLKLTTYLYLPVHSLLRHFLLPDSLPTFRNSSGIYIQRHLPLT